jgi:NADH:ubiquinone oxidoreductase subunit 5 (subunit L)/multisubunit Na+/H+ antiporter MnhA subunit
MAVPMMVLCFGSIFSGYFLKDAFVGLGSDFFKHTIFVKDLNSTTSAEFIPVWVKLAPTVFSLAGLAGAVVFCSCKQGARPLFFFKEKGVRGAALRAFRHLFKFLSNK